MLVSTEIQFYYVLYINKRANRYGGETTMIIIRAKRVNTATRSTHHTTSRTPPLQGGYATAGIRLIHSFSTFISI